MTADLTLSESTMERIPPQSIEAEQAILGSLLVNNDTITRIVDQIEPEYFYRKAHQIIYAAILDLFDKNEPIDIVTLSQYLKDQGNLDSVGGRQYLTDLALSIATTANAEYYAKTVNEKALLRNLIKAGTEIVGSCYDDTDADMVVDKAERLIFSIAQRRNLQNLVHIKDIVNDSFARIEKRYEERDSLSGIPSGFYDLDSLTSGFQKSDLIILAARPSMGKCLSADSEIVLHDGSLRTIQSIYEDRVGKLLTLEDDLRFDWTQPSDFVDDGIKPVFKVTTRLGRQVTSTLPHPFLTAEGWKKLAELQVGDKIAVPRALPVQGTERARECEVKLLGYLIGDTDDDSNETILQDIERCLVEYASFATAAKQSLHAFAQSLFSKFMRPQFALSAAAISGSFTQTFHVVPSTSTLPSPNLVNDWLKKLGLHGRKSDAFVPAFVFRLAPRLVSLFLNRLFAANGYAVISHGKPVITMAHKSERLGRQVQHLLLRFGVLSKLYKASEDSLWHLSVSDDESLTRFINNIGIFGQEEELEFFLRSQDEITSDENIYWDEIVSIESEGDKQVYDLTIPETHNFVANDICVHNTALCLNIAQHAAVEARAPVAVFSLEMSKEQLVQRLLCAEAKIDANKMRTGFLQSSDWTSLAAAMGRLGEAPIFIDDSAVVTALDIRAKARRLKAENKGLGMIIIDYIQLMQGRSKGGSDNRVQEVSEISRGLKQLARELDVPVIALSQLSRAVEARQNKRPMLSDLRESGCLAGETMVFLPDTGRTARIDSLLGKTGFNVLAFNSENSQMEKRKVTNSFCTGIKPVFKLITKLGEQIRATANHKFLTGDGWKRLDTLTPGEHISVPTRNSRGEIHGSDWDEITSVESDGESSVYDLTVEGLHNFVANNITVHNSIEQDADIVMFIYRDEYYNQESEKRGEAEIIIAKQRNGPVGTVDLLYQSNITRFLNKAVQNPAYQQ